MGGVQFGVRTIGRAAKDRAGEGAGGGVPLPHGGSGVLHFVEIAF